MKKKIFLTVLTAVLVCFCSFSVAPINAEDNDYSEKPDSFYSYVQSFTDVSAVNNAFHAYYLENALGSAKAESVVSDVNSAEGHWAVDGGALKRINDVKKDENSGSYETNQVAVLTFTKESYLNFELSVDVKSGSNGFWPVIAIRQAEEGKYYLDDGAGVFVQHNGVITLWGDKVMSGPYEFGSVEGWQNQSWHNWQIRVLGNELFVSIDHAPWVKQELKEDFYNTGYGSLCSVNNESEYRNFRIKALAEPEAPAIESFAPVKEATSSDALSNLAGEVKSKDTLFEREPSNGSDTSDDGNIGKKGCGGSVSANFAAILPLLALALVKVVKK